MQNLEQKFRCADLAGAEAKVRSLKAVDRGVLRQTDYFFPAPHARLKLRIIEGHDGAELISYRRSDTDDARTSDYTITPVHDARMLLATLTHAFGTPRILRKSRHLFIHKSTRIHVDRVDGMGGFVELETLLTTQTPAEAQAELDEVVKALGLSDTVSTAYVDLPVV